MQTLSHGYLASRYQSHDVNKISLFLELKNLTLCPEGTQFPLQVPNHIFTLGKNNSEIHQRIAILAEENKSLILGALAVRVGDKDDS